MTDLSKGRECIICGAKPGENRAHADWVQGEPHPPIWGLTAAERRSSGYYAKIGSSGYSAEIEATGKKSILAAVGYDSIAKAGEDGCIALTWFDREANRPRLVVGYVGEDGIKADTWYRVESGKLLEVK